MSIINNMPTKGGMTINGVIEEYYAYAGQTISPGDFVKFVNGIAEYKNYGTVAADTIADSRSGYPSSYSLEMPNGQVVYIDGDSIDPVSFYLLEFTNVEINIVATASIPATYDNPYYPCLIDDTRFFLPLSYQDNALDYKIYGMVVQVTNNTITLGTISSLYTVSSGGSYKPLQAFLCSDGHVTVLSHNSDSEHSWYYSIYTINGTTFTTYKGQTSITDFYSGNYYKGISMGNDKFLITRWASGEGTGMDGVHCQVMTLTYGVPSWGTITPISDAEKAEYGANFDYGYNKVFFTIAGTSYKLLGVAGTVSGTTITVGAEKELSSQTYRAYTMLPKIISSSKVVVAFGISNQSGCGAMVVNLSGDTIYPATMYNLSTTGGTLMDSTEITQLSNPNLFRTFYYEGTKVPYIRKNQVFLINGDVVTKTIATSEYEIQVQKATTKDCNGVAKTGGTGGNSTSHKDKIQVYTPNTN